MTTLNKTADKMSADKTTGHKASLLLGAGLALALLSGCDTAREAFGLEKQMPDEFTVVTKAPLVLPPDFTLRPPQPGASRPQEMSPRERAQTALSSSRREGAGQTNPWLRSNDPNAANRSPGENALLGQAGATTSDPDIRKRINEETSALIERDKSFVDKLVFWRKPDQGGSIIDASRESQRLREATASGSGPQGDVPTIQRRKKGWLEGVF